MKMKISALSIILLLSIFIFGSNFYFTAHARDYSKGSSQKTPETIETLRDKIDSIDREILVLLNERAEAAVEIGKLKEKQGLEVYNPGREKIIEEKLKRENTGPLPDSSVIKIYKEIIAACRSIQY